MEIQVALIILLVALIIAALAIYLIATILQLFKINAGLDVVLGKVGEIVAKSAPVNGVVDAINSNLVAGRDLLENLLLKKAGPDSAGLVESLFPGEGAKFLQRVGKSGKVVNTGTVYTRGVGILASLGRGAPIGAGHLKGPAVRDPQYSTTAASLLYPRPGGDPRARPKSPVVGSNSPHQYEAALTPGARPGHSGAAAPAPAAPAAPPPRTGCCGSAAASGAGSIRWRGSTRIPGAPVGQGDPSLGALTARRARPRPAGLSAVSRRAGARA